ncbi:627_t:CDS:1, partial [Gigaspora rosea]
DPQKWEKEERGHIPRVFLCENFKISGIYNCPSPYPTTKLNFKESGA